MDHQPSSQDQPTNEIRGTIILCDHLYFTDDKKYIIAGTYTTWRVGSGKDMIDFHAGIFVYGRIQVERAGQYKGSVKLIHKAMPPGTAPIQEFDLYVDMRDPLTPFEFGCQLKPFTVDCPEDLSNAPEGSAFGVRLGLWLEIEGKSIASCPLNVIFSSSARSPYDPTHRREPRRDGDP